MLEELGHDNESSGALLPEVAPSVLVDHLNQIPYCLLGGPEVADALLVLLNKIYGFQMRRMANSEGKVRARFAARCSPLLCALMRAALLADCLSLGLTLCCTLRFLLTVSFPGSRFAAR